MFFCSWHVTELDIQATLQQTCFKVLHDTSVDAATRESRARAMLLVGQIYRECGCSEEAGLGDLYNRIMPGKHQQQQSWNEEMVKQRQKQRGWERGDLLMREKWNNHFFCAVIFYFCKIFWFCQPTLLISALWIMNGSIQRQWSQHYGKCCYKNENVILKWISRANNPKIFCNFDKTHNFVKFVIICLFIWS